MISLERIIARVEALRLTWATEAVRNPDRDHPMLAYGEAAGRDAAAQIILDEIREMISDEEEDD